MTKKNQKENKSLEEEKAEVEQQKVDEETQKVSQEIQEILERHNFGLQPYLSATENGIVPGVRLIKIPKENEQNSSNE